MDIRAIYLEHIKMLEFQQRLLLLEHIQEKLCKHLDSSVVYYNWEVRKRLILQHNIDELWMNITNSSSSDKK